MCQLCCSRCVNYVSLDKLFSRIFAGFLPSHPMDQSRDVTPRLGEVDEFSFFDCSSPFCFLFTKFHCAFSISYILLVCYVYYYYYYYYYSWFDFNTLFFCFFADSYCSLPRDQSRDVTPRLGVAIILLCTSFRIHAYSFRVLLLQLCSNSCAEALLVKL